MRLTFSHRPSRDAAPTALILVLVVVVVAGACSTSGRPAGQEQTAAVTAQVVEPRRRAMARQIHGAGTLYGDEETTIGTKVAGRVSAVVRDLGDLAAPGDELVRLDPTDYSLERDERASAVKAALAQIGLEELAA